MIKYTIFHNDSKRLRGKIKRMQYLLDFDESEVNEISYDRMYATDFLYLFSALPSPSACYRKIVDADDRLRVLSDVSILDLCKYLSGENDLSTATISKHRKNQIGYLSDFSNWIPYIIVKEFGRNKEYYMPKRRKFNTRFIALNYKEHFRELYPIKYRKVLDVEGAIKGYNINDEEYNDETV